VIALIAFIPGGGSQQVSLPKEEKKKGRETQLKREREEIPPHALPSEVFDQGGVLLGA